MVKSAARVIEILRHLACHDEGSLHSEIAQALGIPRPSLTGLLSDLRDFGFVTFDEKTRRYSLGAEVLTLSHAYLRSLNIVRVGEPILRDVYNEVHEFTSLVIAKESSVIKVCEFAPPDPLGYHLRVGESGPMYATAGGKAILAHLRQPVRDALLARMDFRAYTTKTIRTRANLLKELKTIRAGGVAYCREEYLEGMISMALPVFDAGDRPVAAIGVNTRSIRYNRAHERKVEEVLREATARLSGRLGNRVGLAREVAAAG